MICDCGGVFLVIGVEESPEYLTTEQRMVYKRVCDVQFSSFGKILYSQPYDDGDGLNLVRKTKPR